MFLFLMVANLLRGSAQAASGFGVFQTVSLNDARVSLSVSNETFRLENAAANPDSIAMALQPFAGSGQIVARIERSTGSGAKAGLVFRENTNADARFAGIFLSGEDKVVFERVLNPNEPPIQTIRTNANARWLRLTREGDTLNGFCSPDGTNWTQIAADTVEMSTQVSAGFLAGGQSEADFRDVRMLSAVFSAPVSGKIILLPADIFLKTDVANFRSKIDRVEFFYGVEKLGERKASPYEMTWSNALAGPDLIFAKVTDEAGAEFFTESAKLQIKLPATRVKFIREDSTTQGNWKDNYGEEGFIIPRHQTNLPPYVQGNFSLSKDYIWTDRTEDKRVLSRNDSEQRIASFWSLHRRQEIELSLTDGNMHRFAIYFLDWNRQHRVALVEVIDSLTQKTLDSREISSYSNGKYLVWSIVGRVKIRITPTKGYAYPAGLFFDPEPGKK